MALGFYRGNEWCRSVVVFELPVFSFQFSVSSQSVRDLFDAPELN